MTQYTEFYIYPYIPDRIWTYRIIDIRNTEKCGLVQCKYIRGIIIRILSTYRMEYGEMRTCTAQVYLRYNYPYFINIRNTEKCGLVQRKCI